MVKGDDVLLEHVHVRLGERNDVKYLFNRTLRDLRNTPMVHGCPNGIFHQYMHRALEHTLTRAITFIAYPGPHPVKVGDENMTRSGDPNRIIGYVVADPTPLGLIVHYANTRKSYNEHGTLYENYQRKGICTKIVQAMIKHYHLPDEKIRYTLKTAMFRYEKEFKRKLEDDPRFEYNPFLFFTLLPPGWETGVRKPSQRDFSEVAYGG